MLKANLSKYLRMKEVKLIYQLKWNERVQTAMFYFLQFYFSQNNFGLVVRQIVHQIHSN